MKGEWVGSSARKARFRRRGGKRFVNTTGGRPGPDTVGENETVDDATAVRDGLPTTRVPTEEADPGDWGRRGGDRNPGELGSINPVVPSSAVVSAGARRPPPPAAARCFVGDGLCEGRDSRADGQAVRVVENSLGATGSTGSSTVRIVSGDNRRVGRDRDGGGDRVGSDIASLLAASSKSSSSSSRSSGVGHWGARPRRPRSIVAGRQ